MALLPDPSALAARPLLAALEHLLDGQPWLRERLLPFAGRSVLLELFPLRLTVRIEAGGRLMHVDGQNADAAIRVPPAAALRILAGDEGARARAEIVGDSALAGAFTGVLRELRWDAEEDLSKVVGDVAARRIVGGASSLLAWQRSAAASLAESTAEYLIEERQVLAGKHAVQRWTAEVDAMRDAVERLEKRIDRLREGRARAG